MVGEKINQRKNFYKHEKSSFLVSVQINIELNGASLYMGKNGLKTKPMRKANQSYHLK